MWGERSRLDVIRPFVLDVEERAVWRSFCLHRGNWFCRAVLGVLLCLGLTVLAKTNRCVDLNYQNTAWAAGVYPSQQVRADQQEWDMERMAKEDPIGLLRMTEQNYQRSVRDYTCTFVKRELIDGEMKTDTMRILFKEDPFSVVMNWREPKGPLDKLLYSEKNGNRDILARPSGLAGMVVSTIRKDVDDEKLKKFTVRTPAQFGIARSLTDILKMYEEDAEMVGAPAKYVEVRKVDNRDCLLFRRRLPIEKGYPYGMVDVYVDKEYVLPTKMEMFDVEGGLIGSYTFTDLRFNLGLADELFDPGANGFGS